MIKPTLETASELAGNYKVIPVCKEIYSDFTTPIQVLRVLKRASKHCYMLESVENQENWGRYTFLGYKPKLCVTCMNGHLKVTDVNGSVIREETAHRLKTVQRADQIVVVNEGKIEQLGRHEELMRQDGIYRRFVNAREAAASWKL